MYQSREDYEKKLKEVDKLRKKYPKMQSAERVGHLVELIFIEGGEEWVYKSYFKELDDILSKL